MENSETSLQQTLNLREASVMILNNATYQSNTLNEGSTDRITENTIEAKENP